MFFLENGVEERICFIGAERSFGFVFSGCFMLFSVLLFLSLSRREWGLEG